MTKSFTVVARLIYVSIFCAILYHTNLDSQEHFSAMYMLT